MTPVRGPKLVCRVVIVMQSLLCNHCCPIIVKYFRDLMESQRSATNLTSGFHTKQLTELISQKDVTGNVHQATQEPIAFAPPPPGAPVLIDGQQVPCLVFRYNGIATQCENRERQLPHQTVVMNPAWGPDELAHDLQ